LKKNLSNYRGDLTKKLLKLLHPFMCDFLTGYNTRKYNVSAR
jgi:hypothetical protein